MYGQKNLNLATKGSDSLTATSPASAPTKGYFQALIDEQPTSGSSLWTASLPTDNGGWQAMTLRQIISSSDISAGGDRIRITFTGFSNSLGVLDNVSIVERSGATANGTTTPTEILFSGSGIMIPAGGTVVSEWLDYTVDADKSYLLCMDVISDSTKDDFRANLSSGAGYYYTANNNSYNVAVMPATTTLVSNRTIAISKIETAVNPTINTDYIAEMSRDGGTTYSPAVLSRVTDVVAGSLDRIVQGDVSFTGDPSGTNMVGRIRTVNNNKVTVKAMGINWD
jgi:hypothetical protein